MTHYGYDDADRLTSITDRLGHIRTYQYSAADQMTGEIWYPDSKSSAVHAVAYGREENLYLMGSPSDYHFKYLSIGTREVSDYMAGQDRLNGRKSLQGQLTDTFTIVDALKVAGQTMAQAAVVILDECMRPVKSLLSCRGSLEVSFMETSTCLGDNGIRSGSSTGGVTSTGNRPAA